MKFPAVINFHAKLFCASNPSIYPSFEKKKTLTEHFLLFIKSITGKGDLVGCDISMHLLANSNGQGGNSQHNSGGSQDVVVKSSSDVKVINTNCCW